MERLITSQSPHELLTEAELYKVIDSMVHNFDHAAERVLPEAYLYSDRTFQDIAATPDRYGVVDGEFRWLVAELALKAIHRMYQYHNPTTYDNGNFRGFNICGPVAIALARDLCHEAELPPYTPDGRPTLEVDIRLRVPPEEPDNFEAMVDHSTLLMRSPGGWVHCIDPLGRLLWDKLDGGDYLEPIDLIMHEVYREEEVDAKLAEHFDLVTFPTQPSDRLWPVWERLHLFARGTASLQELVVMKRMMNDGRSLMDMSYCDDGTKYQTPFWGDSQRRDSCDALVADATVLADMRGMID